MLHCSPKVRYTLATLAMLAFAGPATAADVVAKVVPFRGQAAVQVIGAGVPIEGGFIYDIRATGVVTYFGQFTGVGKLSSWTVAGHPRDGQVEGTITFTTANGDQLNMNLIGTRPTSKLREGTLPVTSGTGRFAGATGTPRFTSIDAFNVTVFTITLDGQITLATTPFAPDVRPSPQWLAAQGPVDAMPVVFGRTREQWSALWWQWALSIPKADSPILDATGDKSGIGQSGPVWFLAGATEELEIVTRTCSVPAGKALFVPIANEVCVAEANRTAEDLFTCVALSPLRRGRVYAYLSVDGVVFRNKAVERDLETFRVLSGLFPVSLPANNILGTTPVTDALAAADGYYVMLAPLPVGQHVIESKTWYITPDFYLVRKQEVTYHITVVAPPAPPPPAPSAGGLSFIPRHAGR